MIGRSSIRGSASSSKRARRLGFVLLTPSGCGFNWRLSLRPPGPMIVTSLTTTIANSVRADATINNEDFTPGITVAGDRFWATALNTPDPVVWKVDAFELLAVKPGRKALKYSRIREFELGR